MSKQIRLTLPDNLAKLLEEQAGKDDRTTANYIIHLLKYIAKKYNRPGGTTRTLMEFVQNKLDTSLSAPIYFPPGVRSIPDTFIPHNTPGGITTIPSPENPDRGIQSNQRYV